MEWSPKPRMQLSAAMDMTRWAWFEAALYCPGAKSPAAAVNRPPFAQSAIAAQEGVRGGMLRALPRPQPAQAGLPTPTRHGADHHPYPPPRRRAVRLRCAQDCYWAIPVRLLAAWHAL